MIRFVDRNLERYRDLALATLSQNGGAMSICRLSYEMVKKLLLLRSTKGDMLTMLVVNLKLIKKFGKPLPVETLRALS